MDHVPGRSVIEESGQELEERVVPIAAKSDVLKDHDRITGNFLLHLENCCDKTQSVNVKFSSFLESQGVQIYRRNIKVGSNPKPLDLGWIPNEAKVGYVVIQNACDINELKRQQLLKPAEDEEPPTPLPVLFVSVNGNDQESDFEVDPGQFSINKATRAHLWRVWSSGEDLKAEVIVYPR